MMIDAFAAQFAAAVDSEEAIGSSSQLILKAFGSLSQLQFAVLVMASYHPILRGSLKISE